MIHVMNPYQMTVAMFRLTSLGLEFQTQMMKTLSQMAMAPLAGMPEGEEEAEEAPAQKTTTARKAASRSRGATKAGATRARKTRKPSAPPTMPEPESQAGATEEGDTTDNMPV